MYRQTQIKLTFYSTDMILCLTKYVLVLNKTKNKNTSQTFDIYNSLFILKWGAVSKQCVK